MYPNVLTSPNNIVLITLCLIAKRFPNNNVTRSTRTNVTMKKNMSHTKKRKLDVSGPLTELAPMIPNVNFMKFFSVWQAQNQPSVRFFSAFDDVTNLQNIIFSNLISQTPSNLLLKWITDWKISSIDWLQINFFGDYWLKSFVIMQFTVSPTLYLYLPSPSDLNNLSVFAVCPGIFMCHI